MFGIFLTSLDRWNRKKRLPQS